MTQRKRGQNFGRGILEASVGYRQDRPVGPLVDNGLHKGLEAIVQSHELHLSRAVKHKVVIACRTEMLVRSGHKETSCAYLK